MMYLDLDEIDQIFALSRWWSTKTWRPARFRRSDFMGDINTPLDVAVRQRIEKQSGHYHRGPIRMLANLSYFGFNINPICIYYCFDEQENLQTIVVDVNNTPWDERQNYVLNCDPAQKIQRINFQKQMHVSPFNPMDMHYDWRSNKPAQHIRVHLENWQSDVKHLDATLALNRQDISTARLSRVLWQYPLMTLKVVSLIYWQALKLWFKKVPVYDHPTSQLKK